MSNGPQEGDITSVLSTKLEEDFILPLTAVRGALEILRDYPDIAEDDRQKFVTSALDECARIERGIADLGAAVYAGQRAGQEAPDDDGRVAFRPDAEIAELDFAGLDFDSAATVNRVFDAVEERVAQTGRRWWFLVDYTGCHVFPEAWIAFAHRGKKVRVEYGYGTIRFDARGEGGLPDRDGALAQIADAKRVMRT